MSGLEVLGATAAAAQFIDQIRDAPESIRKQNVQVEQLIDLSRLIERNPSLQTNAVAAILRTCLVEAIKLQKILSKLSASAQDGKATKLWKALDGVTKEKKIDVLFQSLERQKSSLALSIQAVDSAIIHGILPDISAQLTAVLQKLLINVQVAQPTTPHHTPSEGHFLVPFAQNPDFVGRESYMSNLGARIDRKGSHNRVALVGLGGIGKSQVALEYAYRFHQTSPEVSIYWVYASNAIRFEQDYLRIGKNAGLPGIDDPRQEIKQLVKDWLCDKQSGKWLMIVDNADDANLFFGTKEPSVSSLPKGLSQFLPQCANGSILFTTRNKKAGVKFAAKNIIELEKMTAVEAEELLKTRSVEETSDWESIAKLLEALEYTPLAIAQAAAYMAENSISISEYLGLYNESEASRIELLSEGFEELARDPETINPIAATWVISFEQIRKADILAANLLSFMACLDRRSIPRELLPAAESPVKIAAALGLLKAYSLITATKDNGFFDMHRLVHLTTRSWLRANGTFNGWVKSCLSEMSNKFPDNPRRKVEVSALYLPHTQMILEHENTFSTHDFHVIDLAYRVSLQLRLQGDIKATKVLLLQALTWINSVPKRGNDLNLLALCMFEQLVVCLFDLGKFSLCEKIIVRVLSHPETNRLKGNQCTVRYAIHILHYYHALSVRKQGRENPSKEMFARNIGMLKMDMENRPSMISEFGSFDALDDWAFLSFNYLNLGQFKEAAEACQQALKFYSESQEEDLTLERAQARDVFDNHLMQKRYAEAAIVCMQLLDSLGKWSRKDWVDIVVICKIEELHYQLSFKWTRLSDLLKKAECS